MKNTLFFISIFLFALPRIMGQNSQSLKIKAGDNFYEKILKEIYLYPVFRPGTVGFKNGAVSQSYFNYNMLFGEVEFVNPRGDTLSIANPGSISYVKILKDTFFFDEGYLQLIVENSAAKLAIRQIIEVEEFHKISKYYGGDSTKSTPSYYISLDDLKRFRNDLKRDLVMDKKVLFYIGNLHNNFLRADKKNIAKIFPEKQELLNEFLKKDNYNFNKLEDLIKLLTFLKDAK